MGLEVDGDFAFGGIGAVAAVDEVHLAANAEVTADGAGGRFASIGFTHEVSHDGDGFGAFDDEGDDGAGGDEGFEVGVEGFADVFGVVELAELRGDLEHFDGDDAEAFVFDAGDNAADESALDGIGFGEDQGAFEGHGVGSWGCVWECDDLVGSLEFGFAGGGLHEQEEFGEQIVAVVWSGSGFGVVLDAEDRESFVADAFDSLVVEVDVSDFDVIGECIGVDGEAMIL